MKKNIILIDYDPKIDDNNGFISELEKIVGGKWCIKEKQTNKFHGSTIKNIIRLVWYFLFPLSIVFNRKKYDKIIGWQQFFGLNFAFFCNILHLKKINDVTVMTFIYKKKDGILGKIYHRYMEYIVTSKYIDRFICFSRDECDYYASIFNVERNKFIFIPLGINPVSKVNISDDGSIFATGRSNRDYDFLVNVLKDTEYKVIIACDDYKNINVTSNIKILNSCYNQEMLNLMAKCHCVVVPLKDLNMSSGQLVVLQAMALGKPVICTNSNGIKDYVINNATGILVNNTNEKWIKAINQIYIDSDFYKKISANSLDVFNKKYTKKAMYTRIAQQIK